MGGLLYTFLSDPYSLAGSGWPVFNSSAKSGGLIARFGADGKALQLVAANDVEAVCTDPSATYDPSP